MLDEPRQEPSAGEREGAPLARREPSAGEREGAPLARKDPSAGEREGAPLASKQPSAERDGIPLARTNRSRRRRLLGAQDAHAIARISSRLAPSDNEVRIR